jgi:hypothetical protein
MTNFPVFVLNTSLPGMSEASFGCARRPDVIVVTPSVTGR